ncbi:MAG TPA: XRE family transcriptional regulator [Bacteriovoracaceae bacterium]|nr:XRE family transcriptional regulator [Bacteriovoracaceae bacterium]
MAFPNTKVLKNMRVKLEKAEPSYLLPENATQTDKLKYRLCQKFVIYILKNKVSQAELARRLDMDTARLNEIVKYKIDLFTVDKLIEFTQRLDPNLEISVA